RIGGIFPINAGVFKDFVAAGDLFAITRLVERLASTHTSRSPSHMKILEIVRNCRIDSRLGIMVGLNVALELFKIFRPLNSSDTFWELSEVISDGYVKTDKKSQKSESKQGQKSEGVKGQKNEDKQGQKSKGIKGQKGESKQGPKIEGIKGQKGE
ncbi:43352_t:CDS:2, partial [Gigaspora margarita]